MTDEDRVKANIHRWHGELEPPEQALLRLELVLRGKTGDTCCRFKYGASESWTPIPAHDPKTIKIPMSAMFRTVLLPCGQG